MCVVALSVSWLLARLIDCLFVRLVGLMTV